MESRSVRCCALSAFVVAAALFGISALVSAEPLRIAYTSIGMVDGPLWLTQETALFKKYNLESELVYIAGGPPSTQALIAGDVQIAFTAAGAVVSANLSGSDVVFLGTSIPTLPFELWSIPTIKEPSQLRGTKLGVSRIGATSDFVARYLLKKWNLQPSRDVVIFQTGDIPNVFAALKGGSIQSGIMSTGPFTILAQAEGFQRLADLSSVGLAYAFGPFAARQLFLKDHPEAVRRFLRAYVEGIHLFKTNKEAALAAIEKYTRVKSSTSTERVYEIYATKYFKRLPEVTSEEIQTSLEEVASTRALPPGITPQRFVEAKFVRELADSGFVDNLYRGR